MSSAWNWRTWSRLLVVTLSILICIAESAEIPVTGKPAEETTAASAIVSKNGTAEVPAPAAVGGVNGTEGSRMIPVDFGSYFNLFKNAFSFKNLGGGGAAADDDDDDDDTPKKKAKGGRRVAEVGKSKKKKNYKKVQRPVEEDSTEGDESLPSRQVHVEDRR